MNKCFPLGQGKSNLPAYIKERGPAAREYEERLDEVLQKVDAQHEKEKNIRRLVPGSADLNSNWILACCNMI